LAAGPLFPRHLSPLIRQALADTPVVLVNGPRQSGKTTLAQQISGTKRRFLTLDDAATLESAQRDPTGFIRAIDIAAIDEVQRAPALLLAIKQAVDTDRRPGRFLLTGSANVMTLPKVADSLAGRIEVHTLLPLAGCEVEGHKGLWLDALFARRIPQAAANAPRKHTGPALLQRVLEGGYPEALARSTARRREAWMQDYADALIARDVREIASIEKLDQMRRLLSALAQMSGQLLNLAQLGGQVGLDGKTAGKYVAVLEQMYLLRRVQPWFSNRLSRIVKTPKVHFLDSGLLATLAGVTPEAAAGDHSRFGHILESFVYGELCKLAGWAHDKYAIHCYRDKDQVEVDFVIENRRGQVAGVEVKAAASVNVRDLAGLRRLSAHAGNRFACGVLLYDGAETLPMGDGLWAAPLSTLWLT
jgi:predicted AAA+ superfamily ATPase